MAVASWERARAGWTCQTCDQPLRRGKTCWGLEGRWWHLECALKTRPAGFAPYAAHAPMILARENPAPPGKASRNAKLEAKILAAPKDRAAIAVYGDWLQAEGDPWGELIALALAGKRRKAELFLEARLDELAGGLDQLTWRDGLIREAAPYPQKPSTLVRNLRTIFGLRTAFALEQLDLAYATPETLAEVARAPRGLRTLIIDPQAKCLDRLAHPTVTRLVLTRPVHPSRLAALVASPLFRRIEVLAIERDDADDGLRAAVKARPGLRLALRSNPWI